MRRTSHSLTATSNRVSAVRKRILKIGDRRLPRGIERWWPNIREIELQRPRYFALIARNVARIYVSGKLPLETRLTGWGARIRTWEWRNQNPLPYHLATPQYRRIGAGRLGRLRNIATGPAPSNVRPRRP